MASSLRECTQAMRSTAGMRRWIPEPRVLRYLPNRSTTKAFFSGTMLTPQFNGVMGGSDLGRERINFSYQKVPEASGEAGRGGGRGMGLPGVVVARVREGEEPPLGHRGSPEEACHPRQREMGGGGGLDQDRRQSNSRQSMGQSASPPSNGSRWGSRPLHRPTNLTARRMFASKISLFFSFLKLNDEILMLRKLHRFEESRKR
jgi:hypothetical protein